MLPLLKELITRNPFVDEVDFSKEGISHFDPHSVDLLGRFTELRKVSCIVSLKSSNTDCELIPNRST